MAFRFAKIAEMAKRRRKPVVRFGKKRLQRQRAAIDRRSLGKLALEKKYIGEVGVAQRIGLVFDGEEEVPFCFGETVRVPKNGRQIGVRLGEAGLQSDCLAVIVLRFANPALQV